MLGRRPHVWIVANATFHAILPLCSSLLPSRDNMILLCLALY